MILGLVDEAVAAGARQDEACKILDISSRALQRWREQEIGDDQRAGPKHPPKNKLSVTERRHIVETANTVEIRDLSPNQIVPILADQGIYIGSTSTIFRVLHEHDLMKHRSAANPSRKRYKPKEYLATGPNQVWSWDITYLRSPVRGTFYYLFMVVDVWSRKIMGADVHEEESSELASELINSICFREGIERQDLVLHSDNGGPMKGATMLTTLNNLGIVPSFSRPRVSNDNPYSEALFKTLKYCPKYPSKCFSSLQDAREWVTRFIEWYNNDHRHSAIRFVTPEERHSGREIQILENRKTVFENAKKKNPERWSGKTRNWTPVKIVRLNPDMDAA